MTPFRLAWVITTLMEFAALAMGAVGVYKMWLTATVRPVDDVPAERSMP